MNPAENAPPAVKALTGWITSGRRIVTVKAGSEDVDLLDNVASQMQGKCLCALGEFSIMAVISGIEQFRPDFVKMSAKVVSATPNGVSSGVEGLRAMAK